MASFQWWQCVSVASFYLVEGGVWSDGSVGTVLNDNDRRLVVLCIWELASLCARGVFWGLERVEMDIRLRSYHGCFTCAEDSYIDRHVVGREVQQVVCCADDMKTWPLNNAAYATLCQLLKHFYPVIMSLKLGWKTDQYSWVMYSLTSLSSNSRSTHFTSRECILGKLWLMFVALLSRVLVN